MIINLGDDAANEFDAIIGTMDEARDAGQITDNDWLLIVAVEQLRAMRPRLEEIALTMRAHNQLNLVGVSRFPGPALGRAITELRTYREARRIEEEKAAGLLRFEQKKRRRTDSSNATAG